MAARRMPIRKPRLAFLLMITVALYHIGNERAAVPLLFFSGHLRRIPGTPLLPAVDSIVKSAGGITFTGAERAGIYPHRDRYLGLYPDAPDHAGRPECHGGHGGPPASAFAR